MRHDDNAFAAMLLTGWMSPEKAESVRPLSSAEYYRLLERAERLKIGGLGRLIGQDLSSIMGFLELGEQDAYRLYALLNRVMPLSYELEAFSEEGIEIVTFGENLYPARLSQKLADKAPPMLYLAGDIRLTEGSAVAMMGNSAARDDVAERAREAARAMKEIGLTMISGGDGSFGQLLREETAEEGQLVELLSDSLSLRLKDPVLRRTAAEGRAVVVTAEHPRAGYSPAAAAERNRCVYAMARAAFVFSCEKERGVAWEGAWTALKGRLIDRLYVWDCKELPGNQELIRRGAMPFDDVSSLPLAEFKRLWDAPRFEQMSMF